MTKARDTHFHKLVKKLISTERTKLLKSILEPLKPVEIANILLQLNLQPVSYTHLTLPTTPYV